MTAITSTEQAVKQLAYDLNGVEQNPTLHNPFSTLPSELAMTPAFGLLAVPYSRLWNSGKAYINADSGNRTSAMRAYWNSTANKVDLKYLKDENSVWNSIKNRNNYRQIGTFESYLPGNPKKTFSELTTDTQRTKYYQTVKKKDCYREARKLIEQAKKEKMTGQQLKEQLEKIRKAYAQGKLEEHIARTEGKVPTRGGNVVRWVKNKSGYNALKTKTLTAATKATKTGSFLRSAGKLAKGGKGNLLFAGIMAVSEIGDIKESYDVDKKTGNKQLAKSGVKIAASVGGYAAGSALAGAALGAACGSVVPVIGTIIGAAAGCIAGAIASWGAGKLWDKANHKKGSFDKSEAQLAQEANAEKLTNKAKGSFKVQEEMLAEVAEPITDEKGNLLVDEQGNPLCSEDTLKAYEYLIAKREEHLEEIDKKYNPVLEKLNQIQNIASGYNTNYIA